MFSHLYLGCGLSNTQLKRQRLKGLECRHHRVRIGWSQPEGNRLRQNTLHFSYSFNLDVKKRSKFVYLI